MSAEDACRVTYPGDQSQFPRTEKKSRRFMIIKNLFVISVSIMLLFTATQSVEKLQSSVHFEGQLGTTVLSVINAFNVISSFFFAAYIVKTFGPKLVFVISIFGFLTYIIGNFYASWYTLIPAAIIMGMASGTLYASLWSYIGTLGTDYVTLTGVSTEIIYARFYGVFFMFSQSASIWGNVISFKVLETGSEMSSNFSQDTQACGANFCDSNVKHDDNNFVGIPSNFYMLIGIFTAVAVTAIVCACFLDRQEPRKEEDKSTVQGILETAKKVVDPMMILVFPITFYGGLQLAFITGDYTKSYITCAFGISNVGYIFICYGVVSTVFSLVVGYLVKLLGRKTVFIFSSFIDVGVYVTLALHHFRGAQAISIHFILIGLLGVTTGVWQGQVKALYGSLFPDCQEVAFALLGVFEPLGISLGFAYSSSLCTLPKLYILGGFLLLGMLGYGVVEYVLVRRNKQTSV